jgi:surface protein
MSEMFYYAESFNKPLGTWVLNPNVDMYDMLNNCGMDCANYSATLSGWANNPATPVNRQLGALGLKYGTNAIAARNILTIDKAWTITGDIAADEACLPIQPEAFIITINTENIIPGSSNETSFTLPTTGSGYDYEVDWDNDGIYDETNLFGNATHDYGTPGIYTLRIQGDFPRIYFNNSKEHLKLLDVKQWGDIAWTSMENAFYGCKNLNITATDLPNLTGVSSMAAMFKNCSLLNSPTNINEWNTENITDMSGMFAYTDSFNQPIGKWNTSSVTDMSHMLISAEAFNQPIGKWNTSSVTNMYGMFWGAESFNQPIGNWNTENVTNMSQMFSYALDFDKPLEKWNTANVTNMYGMFWGAESFNQPIGNWNTENVTNMHGMFASAASFNQPIEIWNTSSVANMGGMFVYADSFNQPLENWNTENVEDMSNMFLNANSFNQPLGEWALNPDVDLTFMLNNCGMDCANYSATLSGWANNPATPSNRKLGALNLKYKTSAEVARNILTTDKAWTITGDIAADEACLPIQPEAFIITINTENISDGSSNATSFTLPTTEAATITKLTGTTTAYTTKTIYPEI